MKLVALTAPSGAGKTTIARAVREAIPQLQFSVSATTRPPRAYEQEGVHYYFVTPDAFREKIADGDFLEYEEVYPGLFYGTLASEVEKLSQHGPVLLDIDVKGAENVKARFGDRALVLFVQPPSLEVLAERLRARQTESDETLAKRLARAEMELGFAKSFDAVVVNDELQQAIEETLAHIRSFLSASD